ncbi:MAG: hypothetical protein ACKOEZ_13865 [Spartobacteria bacterium]
MRKIYKISREEARRQAALAGITPLPEDSPYYSEGVSIQFVPSILNAAPAKKPDGKQEQEQSGNE